MEIDSTPETPATSVDVSMENAQTLCLLTREENPNRPDVFDSVVQGKLVLKQEADKVFAKIRSLAKRTLDGNAEAIKLVAPSDMMADLRCACEYILVEAARHIFDEPIVSCKAVGRERVQHPFELFDIQRLASIDTSRPAGQKQLFEEIHRQVASTSTAQSEAAEDEEPAVPPHLAGLANMMQLTVLFTSQTFCHADFSTGTDGPNTDPRMSLAILAPMTRDVAYAKWPVVLGKSGGTDPTDRVGRPLRCSVTNRPIKAGDAVRYFRMLLPLTTTTTNNNNQQPKVCDFMIEGVLDHSLWSHRLQQVQGAQAAANQRKVSELGIRLLTFARVADWLRDEILPLAHQSVSMAQGVISFDVLEGQRNKSRQRRRKKTSAGSAASVLKKNKPDEFEEKVLAWHDFAYSPAGVRAILKLFQDLKLLQIGFVRAYRDLGSVLVSKT